MAASTDRPPDLAAPFEAVPRRDGPDVVIFCRGELDLAGAPRVAQLTLAIGNVGCERVVLDLSELSFIDACGIGAIERARGRLSDRGVEVVVRHPQPAVRRVLELCGLDGRLEAGERKTRGVDPRGLLKAITGEGIPELS